MKTSLPVSIVSVTILVLSGCGTWTPSLPAGDLDGPVVYASTGSRTGGYGSLTINPDGSAVLLNRLYLGEPGTSKSFQVSSEKMDNLKNALRNSASVWHVDKYISYGMEEPYYNYVSYNGQKITIGDLALTPGPLQDLVNSFTNIMNECPK
jgi:hypothetical protein